MAEVDLKKADLEKDAVQDTDLQKDAVQCWVQP
jgi:hypothetical protein